MVMHTLNMPRLGETMDEGRIANWLVAEGASFRRGEPIVEIETDKTVVEFPALGDGTLIEHFAQEGDNLNVGDPLARIEIGNGADWPDLEDASADPAPPKDDERRSSIIDLAMPRLGETMEEGRIVRWLKAAGETFDRGEAIFEVETDKTVAEYPALRAGKIIEIVRGEDETVAVGETIARTEVRDDQAAAPAPKALAETAQALPREPQSRQLKPVAGLARSTDRRRATPVARRIARQNGIDIASVIGTGRRGRIEKHDVVAAVGAGTAGTGASDSGDGTSFVDLAEGRMAYVASGPADGAAVLLVHGFAAEHSIWAATAASLARSGRRVIAPDLPGHGATIIEAATAIALGEPLSAFADKAPARGRYDVIAHSLGAVAAVSMAEARTDRVASLTLVAPAGLGLGIDQSFVQGMAAASAPGEVAHLLRRISVRGSELSPQAHAEIAREMSRGRLIALAGDVAGPAGQRIDILPALARLAKKMPVRVIFGLQDRIIPWEQVTALPSAVSIHLMAASGHMPQWDQTREFLEIVGSSRVEVDNE